MIATAAETQEWAGTLYSTGRRGFDLNKIMRQDQRRHVDEAPFRKAAAAVFEKHAGKVRAKLSSEIESDRDQIMCAVIARCDPHFNQYDVERLAALDTWCRLTVFMWSPTSCSGTSSMLPSRGGTSSCSSLSSGWFYLGAVAAMKSDSHYAVETLMEVLPKVPAVAVGVLTDLAVIVICGVLAWYGYRIMMLFSFQSSPSLELPMVIVNASLPLAALLMGVVRGVQMIERIRVDLLGGVPLARHIPSITHHAP